MRTRGPAPERLSVRRATWTRGGKPIEPDPVQRGHLADQRHELTAIGSDGGTCEQHGERDVMPAEPIESPPQCRNVLLSVIVPAYNSADTIAETLQSIREQAYRPIEIVVIDDGSSDGTRVILDGLAAGLKGDEGLRLYVETTPNGGAATARNRGIQASNGEYILFIDSDDLLNPAKLQLQAAALDKNPSWKFTYGPIAKHEEQKRHIWGTRRIDWRAAAVRQLSSTFFTTMGPLLRRSFVHEIGPWDETLGCCQDWDYHIRMAYLEPSFGFVPDAIGFYRTKRLRMFRFVSGKKATVSAVRDRAAVLHKALHLAPPALAEDMDFRREAAWCLLDLSATELTLGEFECAGKNLRDARKWADNRLVRILLSWMQIMCLAGLSRLAARSFYAVSWCYWKVNRLSVLLEMQWHRFTGLFRGQCGGQD